MGLFRRIDNVFQPLRLGLERSAIAHLLAIGLALITFSQLTVDLIDRRAERNDRRQAQIERAWSHLMMRASDESGKGESLNTLFDNYGKINGVDLSCRNIGDWDPQTNSCKTRTVFSKVHIPAPPELNRSAVLAFWDPTVASYPYFTEADIRDSSAIGVTVDKAHFSQTRFTNVNLRNANLTDSAMDVDIQESDLSGAMIRFSVLKMIGNSNISDALLYFREGPGQAVGEQMWAGKPENWGTRQKNWFWADRPPRRLVDFSTWAVESQRTSLTNWKHLDGWEYTICDPAFRQEEVWLDRMWRTMTGSINEIDLGETYPDLIEVSVTDDLNMGCIAITLDEAMKSYPASYIWAIVVEPVKPMQKKHFR